MPIYAGETIRIKSSAVDFDGSVVGAESEAYVEIVTAGNHSSVLPETAMSWDGASAFFYDWDSSAAPAGNYLAKVRIGSGEYESWEFKRFRLARNPY